MSKVLMTRAAVTNLTRLQGTNASTA